MGHSVSVLDDHSADDAWYRRNRVKRVLVSDIVPRTATYHSRDVIRLACMQWKQCLITTDQLCSMLWVAGVDEDHIEAWVAQHHYDNETLPYHDTVAYGFDGPMRWRFPSLADLGARIRALPGAVRADIMARWRHLRWTMALDNITNPDFWKNRELNPMAEAPDGWLFISWYSWDDDDKVVWRKYCKQHSFELPRPFGRLDIRVTTWAKRTPGGLEDGEWTTWELSIVAPRGRHVDGLHVDYAHSRWQMDPEQMETGPAPPDGWSEYQIYADLALAIENRLDVFRSWRPGGAWRVPQEACYYCTGGDADCKWHPRRPTPAPPSPTASQDDMANGAPTSQD